MGGVDNLSRLIVPYCIQRKRVQSYRKIAEIFIELAIYNGYIVWNKLNNSKHDQKKFREEFVRTITRRPQRLMVAQKILYD